MRQQKPTVIDFFCGAGGFSEGFRQQGFEIIMGIDNWRPAIETHNLNHGLHDEPRDVLEFESIDAIEKLPDSDVIVGSPPCVLFSLSNKGGKADKSVGIRLIEAYLRVIAVKKHKPKSKLKAWFLENVPNSRKYFKSSYTFRDLQLDAWAKKNGKSPTDIALMIDGNWSLMNTRDLGVAQKRERFVCGEIVRTGRFPQIEKTHGPETANPNYRTLKSIKSMMPSPNQRASRRKWRDPNYPELLVPMNEIVDHFYDSGVYEVQWRYAKYAKQNHPFMGRMSFPEDENGPSRTIMATRASSTREAILYKSERKRSGDGEYRLPTIRELACLMGFPYLYQFTGGEATKCAQVGNAVCPPMSAAIARAVRKELRLKPMTKPTFASLRGNHDKIERLDTFSEKKFDRPPQRKTNAKFRRHPFKSGNMTVALMNFDPTNPHETKFGEEWHTAVFWGTGKDFQLEMLPKKKYKDLQHKIITRWGRRGKSFITAFDRRFRHSIGRSPTELQRAYELRDNAARAMDPSLLVDKIAEFIEQYDPGEIASDGELRFAGAPSVHARQVMAMYALNRIVSSN